MAEAVAKVEDSEASVIKADIIKDISRSLARAASRAIRRRMPRYDTVDTCGRILAESATLDI